jgi:hypothetical protein
MSTAGAGECRPLASCTCTVGEVAALPLTTTPEGAVRLAFEAPAGLYQFSTVVDGQHFDWNELYVDLHLFGNTGQRTGPWDFHLLKNNTPCVPSYWVSLDGRRLGLWYCQRISLEDLAAKRFRGHLAFHVGQGGRHELEFTPYQAMAVSWLSALLERDPEDHLEPRSVDLSAWATECPAVAWADGAFWSDLKDRLATTHALYREPMQRAFRWLARKALGDAAETAPPRTWKLDQVPGKYHPHDILLLLALHHLDGRPDALAAALATVDEAIALPHWGNPREDGYGCDGDMGAAQMLRTLAWACHSLRDHLGDERRARLLARLQLQGQRFFDLALLHRDYWGGSVLQDHGKISLAAFATASITLLGTIPEAELWTAFAIPRFRRNLLAMPRDGAIPPSSYWNHHLYLDEPTFYRDTLLALTGEDIFDQAPFRPVIDYTLGVLREREHMTLVSPQGVIPFIGANAFFNRMASKHRDRRAAYLQELLLRTPEIAFYHGTQEHAYYHGALWGLLTYEPAVPPARRLARPPPLQYYEDSGLAHYRDCRNDVTLSVRCGPWCGYNAYRRAQGPCDRMEILQGTGHFILAVGGTPLLVSPDTGYSLRWTVRSCLLVDDQGPYGDSGYPMSIPSYLDRGAEIQFARWDETQARGWIRLNLGPAYPQELDIAAYTRDFILEEGRRIVCRDRIVASEPRRLAWLFQGLEANGIVVEGPRSCRFGQGPTVRIEAQPVGLELGCEVRKTEVVWSYASAGGFKPFVHARFESAAPVAAATVDFVITLPWPAGPSARGLAARRLP